MRAFLVLTTLVFGVAIFVTPNTHQYRRQGNLVSAATPAQTSGTEFAQTSAVEPEQPAPIAVEPGALVSAGFQFEQRASTNVSEALLRVREAAEDGAPAVADWWRSLPPGPFRDQALEQLLFAWSHSDLLGAIAWCQQLPEIPERNRALASLSYETAHFDPRTSLIVASQIQDEAGRDAAVAHAYSQWASAEDLEIAGAWAMEVENASLREKLLGELALVLAEQDGPSAAALVATEIREGREQLATAVGVVQRWAQKEPLLAAEWVARFPEGEVLRDAAFELMSVWTESAPAEVKRWFGMVPAGPFRNACAEALATLEHDRQLN